MIIASAPRWPFSGYYLVPRAYPSRTIAFGTDGAIPRPFLPKVEQAIYMAYWFADRPHFVGAFRQALQAATNRLPPPTAYVDALNKMVIHLAETSKNPLVRREVGEENRAAKKDARFKLTPAFSIPNGRDVWLRKFLLRKDAKAIAGSLIHEAAHLAGVPASDVFEFAIEHIHQASLPR